MTTRTDSLNAAEQPETISGRERKFVVLEHDSPFLHWDLLIEDGIGLAAWRLLQRPGPAVEAHAVSMPVHRRHYLTWEGPVSGGRGSVKRVYSGTLTLPHDWPSLDEWLDLMFTIHDSSVGSRCRLKQNTDDGNMYWEFV